MCGNNNIVFKLFHQNAYETGFSTFGSSHGAYGAIISSPPLSSNETQYSPVLGNWSHHQESPMFSSNAAQYCPVLGNQRHHQESPPLSSNAAQYCPVFGNQRYHQESPPLSSNAAQYSSVLGNQPRHQDFQSVYENSNMKGMYGSQINIEMECIGGVAQSFCRDKLQSSSSDELLDPESISCRPNKSKKRDRKPKQFYESQSPAEAAFRRKELNKNSAKSFRTKELKNKKCLELELQQEEKKNSDLIREAEVLQQSIDLIKQRLKSQCRITN